MSDTTAVVIMATFVNVLSISSLYILVALGFALLLNIMGIINLAHGVIYMVGAYVCFRLVVYVGINPWLALLITIIVVGALGLFLEKFAFRPFAGDFNKTVMVCIAIIVILENAASIAIGYSVQSIRPGFAEGVVRAGIFAVGADRLVAFAVSAVLLIAMIWFINKTKPGLQMQATSQDREGAILQGININRVAALACFIACALAAIAGSLMGAYTSVYPYMGDNILQKVLEVVILGGIGSMGGIFYAGLVVGACDAILPVFLSGAASQAIALGIVIVILLFRPQGFLGREQT